MPYRQLVLPTGMPTNPAGQLQPTCYGADAANEKCVLMSNGKPGQALRTMGSTSFDAVHVQSMQAGSCWIPRWIKVQDAHLVRPNFCVMYPAGIEATAPVKCIVALQATATCPQHIEKSSGITRAELKYRL